MELKQIKELMGAMGRTGTTRLTIEKDNFKIIIEREQGAVRVPDLALEWTEEATRPPAVSAMRADQTLTRGSEESQSLVSATRDAKESGNSRYITSPMVGTFYLSPSPEAPHFVKVGDRVDKDRVVCIIEAMKVMNEIKANAAGVIVELLTTNGQMVEFGTKLFRVTDA